MVEIFSLDLTMPQVILNAMKIPLYQKVKKNIDAVAVSLHTVWACFMPRPLELVPL